MAARREGEHPASPWRPGAGEDRDSGASPSAILLVGLVGATATTAAEVGTICVLGRYASNSKTEPAW
nr:unnamed protein product [Digitaria exilis]